MTAPALHDRAEIASAGRVVVKVGSSSLTSADGRLDPQRLRRYTRRIRRTHHFWTVRALSVLLEGMGAVDRRFHWSLYPAAFDAYFRVMHLLLLRVARPISRSPDA